MATWVARGRLWKRLYSWCICHDETPNAPNIKIIHRIFRIHSWEVTILSAPCIEVCWKKSDSSNVIEGRSFLVSISANYDQAQSKMISYTSLKGDLRRNDQWLFSYKRLEEFDKKSYQIESISLPYWKV